MSLDHTAEQLEAAHRQNDQCMAVRIILRHITAAKKYPSLRACRHLVRSYWSDPATGLNLIHHWNPN